MKHRLYFKLAAFLCAFALMLPLTPAAYAADGPAVSSNKNRQNYATYGAAIQSCLYKNGSGGLTRVEYIKGKIVVEDYNASFGLVSSRTVPMELSIWGGFFAGENANYLIFGQENPNESDSLEVVRVVKYSKDWQRQGQASINGVNVTVPFIHGCVRCAEYGGYLYIRTSHRMYKSSDGKNHQASIAFAVRQSDMSITAASEDIGYVSHSFNQFILVDSDQNIITVDHGDAFPRSIYLQKYKEKANVGTFGWANANSHILKFSGEIGNNNTGTSVGGFAETAQGYVTAYNDDGRSGMAFPRHVYLGYTTKNGLTSTVKKVSVSEGCTTPTLVPTGLNGGYILWNGSNGYGPDSALYYTTYSDGGSAGAVSTVADAPLSDCQPIYWNGKVVWYVTDDSAPVFYTLDSAGVQKIPANGAASGSTAAGETSTAFSDVPASYWGYGGIQNMVNSGIVSGYPDGTFKPNNTISYVEFVAMVMRGMRSDFLAETIAEMSGSPWYTQVLTTAKLSGLLWGTSMQEEAQWTQKMNQPITRAEMAYLLDSTIFVGDSGLAFDEDLLISQISDWSSVEKDERYTVLEMYAGGVLTGYSDGTIRPHATATRAEACVIVDRAIRLNNGERLPDAKDL